MPKTDDTPQHLRAFLFHGVNLVDWPVGSNQAVGDCPWCGGDKFHVSLDTGQWHCKQCGEEGNVVTFLRKLHEESARQTAGYGELADDRGLQDPGTLEAWGVCKSLLTDEWMVPGYGYGGKLDQLYVYREVAGREGRRRRILLATPVNRKSDADPRGQPRHGLFGRHLFDVSKRRVRQCEGPWDGMILWETLRGLKEVDGGYMPTGNEAVSVLAETNVLAVPGALVFEEDWVPLYVGKYVDLLYDNDHEVVNNQTGKRTDGAGLLGTKRAVALLQAADNHARAAAVRYLAWGAKGQCNPSLPSGWDVRDCVRAGDRSGGRAFAVRNLFASLTPIPDDWLPGRTKAGVSTGSLRVEPLPCSSWAELVAVWRRAMKWHPGLDHALALMLAVVVSTETRGEQLWAKVMGPPSCGKSTLCEALGVAHNHVFQTSVFTGFHSGYKTDKEGAEDHSLIPKVRGKTLVVKDGDTLLRAPNRDQILSEARDLFDGASRAHYRHGVSRVHENVRVTFILCGTGALLELDDSELGARFLNCKMMDRIDREFERGVNWKLAYQQWDDAGTVANGKAETGLDPDKLAARRMTGGYVEYLRANAGTLLGRVTVTEDQLARVIALGEFVAHLRARPSKKQKEVVEREFSGRLVAQYTRLTRCLAAVLGRERVDDEVMRRVRQIALDTAAGKTMQLVQDLHGAGILGRGAAALADSAGESEEAMSETLKYLKKIHVADRFVHKPHAGLKGERRWRLTADMRRLWEEVMGESVATNPA